MQSQSRPRYHLDVDIGGQQHVKGLVGAAGMADIWVEIVEPYRGLVTGLHVPIFALVKMRFRTPDGKVTAYGWETAAYLLERLYRSARAFEARHGELEIFCRQAVREAAEASPGAIDDERFYARRRALRADRRAGLGQRNYQRRLGILEAMRERHHRAHREAVERLAAHVSDQRGDLHVGADLAMQLARFFGLPLPECRTCFPRQGVLGCGAAHPSR